MLPKSTVIRSLVVVSKKMRKLDLDVLERERFVAEAKAIDVKMRSLGLIPEPELQPELDRVLHLLGEEGEPKGEIVELLVGILLRCRKVTLSRPEHKIGQRNAIESRSSSTRQVADWVLLKVVASGDSIPEETKERIREMCVVSDEDSLLDRALKQTILRRVGVKTT